jgi:hypothetical protein
MKRLLMLSVLFSSLSAMDQKKAENPIIVISAIEKVLPHVDKLPVDQGLIIFKLGKVLGRLNSDDENKVTNFRLIETHCPGVIHEIQELGNHCCALTAHNKQGHEKLYAQLRENHINFKTKTPFKDCTDTKLAHIGHVDGIFYTQAPEDNLRIIQHYLKVYSNLTHLIYVSSNQDELFAMREAFANTGVSYQGILYDGYQSLKRQMKIAQKAHHNGGMEGE